MGWNRALQKNNFSSSDFFSHMHCFQSDLEHCLPNNSVKTTYWQTLLDAQKSPIRIQTSDLQGWGPTRWPLRYRSLAFKEFCFLILSLCFGCKGLFSMGCSCGKTIFQALKTCFFRTALMTLREHRLSKITTFQALFFFSALFFETQRSPALQKKQFFRLYFWFHSALMKLREARLCEKTIFKTLKKCFSHTNLLKFRQAWLCKKQIRLYFFFRMPLVKSANSTSLPRLSSLQIVQMHAIHN